VFHPPGRMRLNTGIQSTPPTEEHSAYWTTIHAPSPLSLFVLFCYATLKGSVQRPISEQGRLFLFSLHMFWPVISIHSAILGDMAIYDTTGTYSSSHNGLCVPHCQRPFFLITLKNLPFRNTPAWQTTCAPSDRRARLVLGSRFATPCAERVHLHLLIPTSTPSPIPLPPPALTAEIHGTMAFSWRRLGFLHSFSS